MIDLKIPEIYISLYSIGLINGVAFGWGKYVDILLDNQQQYISAWCVRLQEHLAPGKHPWEISLWRQYREIQILVLEMIWVGEGDLWRRK
jgi:hypothetical protein